MNVEGPRIDVQSDNGVSVLALIGEFDLASKDELQQQFQALREAEPSPRRARPVTDSIPGLHGARRTGPGAPRRVPHHNSRRGGTR